MTKLTWEVLEDNGGGLHLVVFSEGKCVYFGSGYEHCPPRMQDDVQALLDGADPCDWEGEENPGAVYDGFTDHEIGWDVIADDEGVYIDKMGSAGKSVFSSEINEELIKWMRGKRLPAMMGGWIIEVHVNKEGSVTRLKRKFSK